MSTTTRPSANSSPEQLCFNSIPDFTVRADFAGGKLSSDFGAVVVLNRPGISGDIDPAIK